LDENYPEEGGCLREIEYNNNLGEKRIEIKKLDIRKQNLEGSLDLSDFSSLEKLYCSNNQLTNLNLSNCLELTILNCAGNPSLTNLDLDNCRKLKYLICNKNHLKTELDLDKFPELKEDKPN
jgi:Leucine-rich repeat (LRR) protein